MINWLIKQLLIICSKINVKSSWSELSSSYTQHYNIRLEFYFGSVLKEMSSLKVNILILTDDTK